MKIDINKVIDDSDKILGKEFNLCIESKALRSAYIMIWLAGVESLKRKFKETSMFDKQANAIYKEVEARETKEQSIDLFLITKANEFEFIDAKVKKELEILYSLRCLFAHPYEREPEMYEIEFAYNLISENILYLPAKLSQEYIQRITRKFIDFENFLPDDNAKVTEYCVNAVKRIDDKCIFASIQNLLKTIKKDIFSERIKNRLFILLITLFENLNEKDFHKENFHSFVNENLNALKMLIPYNVKIFSRFSAESRASILDFLLSQKSLSILQLLLDNNLVEDINHLKDIAKMIDDASVEVLSKEKIKLKKMYHAMIKGFKSYNFYIQNPYCKLFIEHIGELKTLTNEEQEIIGRNITQMAEGNGYNSVESASNFINSIQQYATNLTEHFKIGMLYECIINEKNELRFKRKNLEKILTFTEKNTNINNIILNLNKLISRSKIKDHRHYDEYAINLIEKSKFAQIVPKLKEKYGQ